MRDCRPAMRCCARRNNAARAERDRFWILSRRPAESLRDEATLGDAIFRSRARTEDETAIVTEHGEQREMRQREISRGVRRPRTDAKWIAGPVHAIAPPDTDLRRKRQRLDMRLVVACMAVHHVSRSALWPARRRTDAPRDGARLSERQLAVRRTRPHEPGFGCPILPHEKTFRSSEHGAHRAAICWVLHDTAHDAL